MRVPNIETSSVNYKYWTVFIPEPPKCQQVVAADSSEDNRLTFDDVRFNRPQYYHAYVLYAPQDRGFVDLMIETLGREGLLVRILHIVLLHNTISQLILALHQNNQ